MLINLFHLLMLDSNKKYFTSFSVEFTYFHAILVTVYFSEISQAVEVVKTVEAEKAVNTNMMKVFGAISIRLWGNISMMPIRTSSTQIVIT